MVTIFPFRAVRPRQLSIHTGGSLLSDTETIQLGMMSQLYGQEKEACCFIQDQQENFYIYQQTKSNPTKTYRGIIATVSIDSYMNGAIQIHENTIESKESYFREHLSVCNFCDEPVLIGHPEDLCLETIISIYTAKSADFEYTTISSGPVFHQLWLVNNSEHVKMTQNSLQSYNRLYIADGHHRSASSVFVGQERRKQLTTSTGSESFNYFMCLFMSFSELEVFSINRVISDLNGKTCEEFLLLISHHFYIDKKSPISAKKFEMYLQGKWYLLQCKEDSYVAQDPVKSIESFILKDLILEPLLNIKSNDDGRIEFVGGHLGKRVLEDKVHSSGCAVAFQLPPLTIEEIKLISDQGKTIPAKSTWIEPKLPRGLTIFDLLS